MVALSFSPIKSVRVAKQKSEAEIDRMLVQRFISGDEGAFVEITRRYREKCHSLAVSVIRNSADAEEIVQDTFIRVYHNLKKFRGDSSLSTWITRITINISRNRYWYFWRRKRHVTASLDRSFENGDDATFTDLIASGEQTPDQEMTMGEFVAIVSESIEELPAQQRDILYLRNIMNRSYIQISSIFGINAGTVKSRIARARSALREKIREKYPDFKYADIIQLIRPDRRSGRLMVCTG